MDYHDHCNIIAPECTTGLLVLLASATGVCSPRKSWQNVSQKCMKPRGYRGVVPFDTFENPTKINKEIEKSMNIFLQIVHRKV